MSSAGVRQAALAALVGLAGCDGNANTARELPSSTSSIATVSAPSSSPEIARSAAADKRRRSNCEAPSAQAASPLDGRDMAALASCPRLRTGEEASASRCGQGKDGGAVASLERLSEAVLAMDEPTRKHVLEIGRRGRAMNRKPRAFGMVGDSMTVSGAFMRPFAAERSKHALEPEIAATLRTSVDGDPRRTIIDYYRGARAVRVQGKWRDCFGAPKAARVGARSSWALVGDEQHHVPLATMVDTLSPAVAVVAFGGNDAAYRLAPPGELADDFERDFSRVLDELERRGVIPVLSTIARHGHQRGLPDCGKNPSELSNWRLAVQTNAINARIAAMACQRHLPLVDLRYALDGLPNRGLDSDGVHPSWYRGGSGKLTRQGLECGYTVRNYLTLAALKQIKELLYQAGIWPL